MHIFRKFGSILFVYFESFEYKNVALSQFGIFESPIPFFLKSLIFFKPFKLVYLKAKFDSLTVSEVGM